jgi:hypothetical protein
LGRRRRIGDVDQADPLARAVGVDQGHAVRRRGDDLGHRRARRIDVRRQVQIDRKGRDALEIVRRRGLARAEQEHPAGHQGHPPSVDDHDLLPRSLLPPWRTLWGASMTLL